MNIDNVLDEETIEDFRINRYNEYETFKERLQDYIDILERNEYSIVKTKVIRK